MAVIKDHPWKSYGALLGALIIAIVTYIDYQTSQKLLTDPYARADSFTGSDFQAFYDREFKELKQEVKEFRKSQENHNNWGKDLAGSNRAKLDRMQRDIQSLQDQILYLYQHHEQD